MGHERNGKSRRRLNRREFLQTSSGALGAISLPRPPIAGPLRWLRRSGGVALMENQTEIWFVPNRALGAGTEIIEAQSLGVLTLALNQGVVLDATALTLRFTLTNTLGAYTIAVETPWFSQPAQADLARWLSGAADLEAATRTTVRTAIPDVGRVTIRRGRLSLDRRLHWTWHGEQIARIELIGGAELTADVAALQPQASGRPQEPFPNTDDRPALLILERARLRQRSGKGFPISDTTLTFAEGEAAAGIYLGTGRGDSRIRFELYSTTPQPPTVFVGSGATGLRPPMWFKNFNLAMIRSGASEYRALSAGLAKADWFSSGEVAVQLSNGPYGAVIESVDGKTAMRAAGLPIVALRVTLPGADWVELTPHVPSLDYRLALDDTDRAGVGIPLDRFRVRACRARDLVDIGFSFTNARLRRRQGAFHLEKADQALPALFRVHLKPQATGEQAYFVQETQGSEVRLAANESHESHESFNPEEKKWRSKEFKPLFKDCEQKPAGFDQDHCKRVAIATKVAQETKPTTNEFNNRPKDCLRPFVYSAEPSRIVFEWPDTRARRLRWSLDDLLDWSRLRMMVHPRSAPRESSWFYQAQLALRTLSAPTVDETSIDAPFRFQLSPLVDEACLAPGAAGPMVSSTTWLTSPPERRGIIELWNTRLQASHVRAVWATGFCPDAFTDRFGHSGQSAPHPTHAREKECGCAGEIEINREKKKQGRLLSLDDRDRHEIVALSSVFGLQAVKGAAGIITGPDPSSPALFSPGPISSDVLALSTVGASLRLRGTWEPPIPVTGPTWGALTVEDWTSRHSWGREVLARVVYKGFLFPLGVRVSLVKVTERRLTRDPLDRRIKAPLWQRLFIVIPKKPKHYPAPRQPFDGRDWDPLKIEFITQQTPDLIDPTIQENTGFEVKNCGVLNYTRDLSCWSLDLFWPQVARGQDVIFKYRVSDRGNKITTRSSRLLFVSNFLAYRRDVVDRILKYYKGLPDERKTASLGGQQVGYAPRLKEGGARPETAFETDRIILDASPVAPADATGVPGQSPEDRLLEELQSANHPLFYPRMARADVRIPAIAKIQGDDAPPTSITYDPTYCNVAFSSSENQAQVFARTAGTGIPVDAGKNSSTTGGVSSPTTRIAAISRSLGLVGGTTNTASREPSSAKATVLAAPAPQDSIAQLQSGKLDTALMFSTSAGEAKILGSLRISEVIAVGASVLGSVPKFVDEMIFDASDAVRGVICGSDATSLGAVLARLLSAVNVLPDSPAKRRLEPRVAGLVDMHTSICANWDSGEPIRLASELASLVTEAHRFIDDVRAITSNPAELVPDDVRIALDGIMTALAPFLPPFNPLDALRNAIKPFIDTVATEAIDVARTEVLAQLEPLKDYFRPALLDAWQALVRLRERLEAEGTAIETAVMTRFAEVSQVITGHVDQLALLAESSATAACEKALALLKEAESHIPHGFEDSLRGLLKNADAAVRELARIARDETLPAEVRRLAASLHSSLRPVWDDVAAVLNRILLDSVIVPKIEDICKLDWKNPLPTVQIKVQEALADAHDFLHRALAPGQYVTLINPILDAVQRAKQQLGEAEAQTPAAAISAAAAAPLGPFGKIKAQLDALETEVDALAKQAILVFTRSPTGSVSAAIQARIDAVKDLVNKAQSAQLSDRLFRILNDASAEFDKQATLLIASIDSRSLLEQLARLELKLWQALMDAAIPGSLPGFDKIQQWHAAWQKALNALQAPAHSAVSTIVNAIPIAKLGPTGEYGKFLAEPVRNDLKALHSALTTAAAALATVPVDGSAIRSLAEAVTLGEQLAKTVAEHLCRGDITAVLSLDPFIAELEDAVRSIVPARHVFKYDWSTALKPFPPGAPIFIPLGGVDHDLEIHSRLEVALTYGGPKASSELSGVIRNFKIALFPGFPLLTILFSEVSFRSRDFGPPTYDVQIDDVELGAAFEFVAALAKLLGGNDDGPYLRLVPSPPAIEAGFSFGTDIAQFGAFTLQNIRISLAFRLPLDNRSATFVFAFASRNKPFLMSAGIYGGGGYLALTATPAKLVAVEGAMEFGAVTAIKFGPLDASGRVVAGFYFRFEESNNALSGYVLATGCGKIAWFGISVLLRVEVKSAGSNVTGSARFEVSFDISSVVKVTFRFEAAYKFKGGQSGGARTLPPPLVYNKALGVADAAPAERPCPDDDVMDPHDPCLDPKASRKRIRDEWRHARSRYARFQRA